MTAIAVPPPPFQSRQEPGRIPAGVLAVLVHLAFFALIVFGVSWQVKPTEPITAELWDNLPPQKIVTPPSEPVLPPAVKSEPPPMRVPEKVAPKEVIKPDAADIELKARKEQAEKKALEARELAQKLAEKKKREQEHQQEILKKKQADEAKRKADEARNAEIAAKRAADEKARAEVAARAMHDAALKGYAQRIADLIRNRANIPDTVTGKPVVQVKVRLLVNGVVFDAQLVKPSGNRVYDEAVERAINGIRQWPLPESPEILGSRRELILNIEHEK